MKKSNHQKLWVSTLEIKDFKPSDLELLDLMGSFQIEAHPLAVKIYLSEIARRRQEQEKDANHICKL